MRFTSFTFLIFLAVVVAVLWMLPKHMRRMWLLVVSYAFYASWGLRFLALLVGTATLNYIGALWIARATSTRRRRGVLIIAGNVVLLAVFKYLEWLCENVNSIGALLGVSGKLPVPHWALPLGISFYLFESISYISDVMRGREKPRSFVDMQLFIAFFPKLIAGPILRGREFFPQLELAKRPDAAAIRFALRQIVIGLFMKVVLVDRAAGGLAVSVDQAFSRPYQQTTAADAWIMSVAFCLQLYFDFSAYTRIALGSSRLCGITLVENFDHPFISSSPAEFWRRWHISLSRWVRDYLFYPLQGGMEATPLRTAWAAFASMVIFGVWHGAGWHFAVWGAYNGLILIAHNLAGPFLARAWGSGGAVSNAVRSVGGWFVTIGLFVAGIPLWRCRDLHQGFGLVHRSIAPWSFPGLTVQRIFAARTLELVACVTAAGCLHLYMQRKQREKATATASGSRYALATVEGVALGLLLIATLVHLEGQRTFVYFAF